MVERWCFPGVKPTVTLRMLKPTRGRNYRPSLTSSRKSYPNPNTPKTRVPTESHLVSYCDLKKCSRLSRLLIARIRPEFRDADARGVPAPRIDGAVGARIWTGHDVLAQTCSKSVPSQPDPHHRPTRRATTDGPNTPWSRPARVFSGRSSLLAVVDILLPGARARGRRNSTTSSPTRQTHR